MKPVTWFIFESTLYLMGISPIKHCRINVPKSPNDYMIFQPEFSGNFSISLEGIRLRKKFEPEIKVDGKTLPVVQAEIEQIPELLSQFREIQKTQTKKGTCCNN